jgi:hypothetical protein
MQNEDDDAEEQFIGDLAEFLTDQYNKNGPLIGAEFMTAIIKLDDRAAPVAETVAQALAFIACMSVEMDARLTLHAVITHLANRALSIATRMNDTDDDQTNGVTH